MVRGLAKAIGFLVYVVACGDAVDGRADVMEDRSTVDSSAPEIYCDAVGPPCGFTVTFEPSGLELGAYEIEITTSAGVTACDLVLEPPRLQIPAEAEAQDAMLADCAAQGTCPAPPCAGPNTVYVGSGGLTVVEESEQIIISIRNVATGNVATQDFVPRYSDHPRRTQECHQCRIAAESMVPPS